MLRRNRQVDEHSRTLIVKSNQPQPTPAAFEIGKAYYRRLGAYS
jgi:hypothetical protein